MKIADKLTEKFPVNTLVAKNQEEYFTVPAHINFGVTAFAFDLTEEDIQDIIKHKRIFITLLSGTGGMQPINVQVNPSDFEEAVEYNQELMEEKGFTNRKSIIETGDLVKYIKNCQGSHEAGGDYVVGEYQFIIESEYDDGTFCNGEDFFEKDELELIKKSWEIDLPNLGGSNSANGN